MLAEALGPELHEPVGDVTQWIGIGHEHVDVASELRVREKLQGREDASRISCQCLALAPFRDLGSTAEDGR
jgi:hypothetical protein